MGTRRNGEFISPAAIFDSIPQNFVQILRRRYELSQCAKRSIQRKFTIRISSDMTFSQRITEKMRFFSLFTIRTTAAIPYRTRQARGLSLKMVPVRLTVVMRSILFTGTRAQHWADFHSAHCRPRYMSVVVGGTAGDVWLDRLVSQPKHSLVQKQGSHREMGLHYMI